MINKSLEVVQDEIQKKVTLRNYSAMNMNSKRRMQLNMMNPESNMTQHEKARLAHKLLVNFSKNLKLRKEKQRQ